MKKKIALINQRYGLEVNGGSELHCRILAEKLLAFYDVEVITTCALEYTTWDNYYQEGIEIINGVTVRRFKTDKSRKQQTFEIISRKVFSNGNHNIKDELEWLDEQGPCSSDFLEYIQVYGADYDAVIYMTYLYYLTARGIMNTPNANIYLLPTAHDEPPIYLKYYQSVFHAARGYIYNTTEEKYMIESMFPVSRKPSIIAGVGVELPEGELPDIRVTLGFEEEYIVYVGRIDESKGCGILFDYFLNYKKETKSNIKLVLVGKSVMEIPQHPDIITLGFVEDEVKFAAIKGSKLLVLASEYESLSMVVLESMMLERPVLVNGKCEVLKGHCVKSEAGAFFTSYGEFAEKLTLLLTDDEVYSCMKSNTKKYVEDNYSWDVIFQRISTLLEDGWSKTVGMNETIDIKEIMSNIKLEIEDINIQVDYPDFETLEMPKRELNGFDLDLLVNEMKHVNLLWDIGRNDTIIKSTGIVGSVKYFIKRLIRKSIRFYLAPLIQQQEQFNVHTVRVLNQMRDYIIEEQENKKK